MARLGIVKLAGKSGNEYKFNAYPLGTSFKEGLGAVYVVTRRRQVKPSGGFAHKKICLGQTDDLRQPLAGGGESLAARGANCICVHGEKDRAARLGIRRDLIQKYRPAGNAP